MSYYQVEGRGAERKPARLLPPGVDPSGRLFAAGGVSSPLIPPPQTKMVCGLPPGRSLWLAPATGRPPAFSRRGPYPCRWPPVARVPPPPRPRRPAGRPPFGRSLGGRRVGLGLLRPPVLVGLRGASASPSPLPASGAGAPPAAPCGASPLRRLRRPRSSRRGAASRPFGPLFYAAPPPALGLPRSAL